VTTTAITPALDERYLALRQAVADHGLYHRAYLYYAIYIFFVLVAVGASFLIVTITTNPYTQTFNAAFLALAMVQGGMLGHDCSHQQVFASYKLNRFFGTLAWGFFGGLSEARWYEKHGAHHTNVNHLGQDPDLDIPFLFSTAQVEGRSRFVTRYILPRQDILFFLALPLIYLNMLSGAWGYFFTHLSARSVCELGLFVVRFGLLFGIAFTFLPVGVAILFLLVHFAVCGAYMSLVFAPNHKGQVVVGAGETTWLDQIILTRNIRSSWPTFFLMGGLNFQIEHHLFSDIARIRYWQVQPLVKRFCLDNGIPYSEVSWVESLQQMRSALKSVRLAYVNGQ